MIFKKLITIDKTKPMEERLKDFTFNRLEIAKRYKIFFYLLIILFIGLITSFFLTSKLFITLYTILYCCFVLTYNITIIANKNNGHLDYITSNYHPFSTRRDLIIHSIVYTSLISFGVLLYSFGYLIFRILLY